MKYDPEIIVITSDEPYHGMAHTQVLYANFLAKSKKVIFMAPPKPWHLSSLFLPLHSRPELTATNLQIIHYLNPLPARHGVFRRMNERLNEKRLSRLLTGSGFDRILLWHFDSYRGVFPKLSRICNIQLRRIYHVIDPFHRNPSNDVLAGLADLIVVTSPRIMKHYGGHRQKILQLPQGVDLSELSVSAPSGPLQKRRQLVLLGTVSDDLRMDWLQGLAADPGWELLIIGKTVKLSAKEEQFKMLSALPNVKYLGLMDPGQFYPLLRASAAGLVLYDTELRAQPFSPLKVLNYLAAGIPVISNVDCEIPALEGKAIFACATFRELLLLLQKLSAGEMNFDAPAAEEYLASTAIEKLVEKIFLRLSEIGSN